MKIKIGTLLDDDLVRQAKKLSVTRQLHLNQVIEKALENYLQQEEGEELLSLDEVLTAEPASLAGHGKGRGGGDTGDQDFG